MEQIIQAQVVAAPLYRDLQQQPFSGRVLGVFNRACNLVDHRQRLIALALPEVGKGPFAVTLPNIPGLFKTLAAGQPARADAQTINVGPWYILLNEAERWNPTLDFSVPRANLELLQPVIRPFAEWPTVAKDTPVARRMAEQGQTGARALMAALRPPVDEKRLSAAVAALAGLGQGLTPAGDDFLLGVMAALWLLCRNDLPPVIVRAALPQTGVLSGAFLKAAACGQFMEPWHALMAAVKTSDEPGIKTAVQWIANFGASSGIDALAGFSQIVIQYA